MSRVIVTGVVVSAFVCGAVVGGGVACDAGVYGGAGARSPIVSTVASCAAAMFRVVVLDTPGTSNVVRGGCARVGRAPLWRSHCESNVDGVDACPRGCV